jgi:hypothetical protein
VPGLLLIIPPHLQDVDDAEAQDDGLLVLLLLGQV